MSLVPVTDADQVAVHGCFDPSVEQVRFPSTPVVGVVGVGLAEAEGVTSALGADPTELPAAFVATTVNVYAVPFIRLVMEQVVAPLVVHDCEPGNDVAV